ncbi:MAG TPA: hypothetical protein VFW30_04135 [Bryocella sp.]|nr:hypothetical protein [Bryocella sp.]
MCTRIRPTLRVLVSFTLLCAAWLSPRLHAQAAQDDTVFQLHGIVLDQVTGKGIGGALVTSMDRRLATLTDSKGRFTFEIAIPLGSPYDQAARRGNFHPTIFFSAERPGYIRMDPLAVSLDDTLSTRTMEIRLSPAASIAGHVYAANSNFPRNIQVMLLQHVIQNGRFTWRPMDNRNTDRHGAFHFGNLQPGEYIVMTREWRGETPLPFDVRSITEQYPPAFLGDASSLNSATPLVLHAGEVANAELHLHRAAYYPVTIPIAGQPSGLSVLINSGFGSGYSLGYVPGDNAVEGSLPDGTYDLHLFSQTAPDALDAADITLHVTSAPLRTAPVTLLPAGNILVRVHLELTSKSAPGQVPLSLQLQPDEMGGRFSGGNAKPGEDEFTINNVPAGRYTAIPMSTYGYVASMTCGGTDLLQQSLVVSGSGSPEPIDITIRDDTATLSGNIKTGDDAHQGRSFVFLLGEEGQRPMQTFSVTSGGEFTFGNVPPGIYRLFAVSNLIRELPYRDSQAMLPWLSQGKLITLAPGDNVKMDAPFVTPPDTAATGTTVGGTL